MASASNLPSYVELRLDRRMYVPGDLVSGEVTVVVSRPKRYDTITVTLEGKTELDVSPKDVGLFEAFYSPPEPIVWVSRATEVAKNGTFNAGKNTYMFELALAPTSHRDLAETLKGLCVRTIYTVRVEVYRGMTSRTLSTECELYVQVPNPDLKASLSKTPPNQFKLGDVVAGEVQSLARVNEPLSGHVLAGRSALACESLDLELVRVEDVFWGEESLREVCIVHVQQIIEGSLELGTVVPFSIVVPRLIVAPSQATDEFQVSYYLNIVAIMKDGEPCSKSVPITFIR